MNNPNKPYLAVDFGKLKRGDLIYIDRFGYGKILNLYEKEIVVKFFDRKIRISPDDKEMIFLVDVPKKIRQRGVGEVNGEKMSFRKAIKTMRANIKNNSVKLTEAYDILGVKKNKLISLCEKYNIEITKYGINNQQFLKLSKLTKAK